MIKSIRGRCQVCGKMILCKGLIDHEDFSLRVCRQHREVLESENMLDARFHIHVGKDKVSVIDWQGTHVFDIENWEIERHTSEDSISDIYTAVYNQYHEVLSDLGLIKED